MNSYNLEMPEVDKWVEWCTYEWDEATVDTRLAFNFYCNVLLTAVNHDWNRSETRLKKNMTDVCTVSDEVFVLMKISKEGSMWINLWKDKKSSSQDDKKIGVEEDAKSFYSSIGKRGKRKKPNDDEIRMHNRITRLVRERRKGIFSEQWCRKVRTADYNEEKLLNEGRRLDAAKWSSDNITELLIVVPNDLR
jgi:hypothetical protein